MHVGIKIVVPSLGRADCVTTNITGQILCVGQDEVDIYKEHNNFEVVAHPKLKNLAAKRNWIIKKFGDVFMVDDDCVNLVKVYKTFTREERNLSADEQKKTINNLYEMAKDLDCKLFGFSGSPVPVQFNPLKPIAFNSNMCGGAYGILDSNLYFDEQLTAADSHWIQLLNLFLYRRNIVDRRYSLEFNDTFFSVGGQGFKRTLDSEKRDTLYLRKMFGKMVKLRKASRNKKNHKYQRFIDYGSL